MALFLYTLHNLYVLLITRTTLLARALAIALCLCLSVRLSQVGVLLKWHVYGSSWFLARRLLSTSHTLCFKELEVSTKIRALSSDTFS